MPQSLQCQPISINGRRTFWTTQLDACEAMEGRSGEQCARPGLKRIKEGQGERFATNDYIRSIALNMLLTDARRPDTRCGVSPGAINGHWSESFMASRAKIGSAVRYVPPNSSVRDAGNMIRAEILTTLQKMVDYKLAVEIACEAVYRGSGLFDMNVTIFGTAADPTRIGLSARRNETSWAWIT
jgi:hypothetical protein